MKFLITENQFKTFIKRRFDYFEPLLKRELKDQEPCYFKQKYGDDGKQLYYVTVRNSLRDYMIQTLPNFWDMEEKEEIKISSELSWAIEDMFKDKIISFYESSKCNGY